MLDHETITEQQKLLATHRRTLEHLVQQAAQYGGEVFAPPQTANGIAEARANIARIKAALREGGVQVEDEPNDETPSQADPNQTTDTGPRLQSTVTVQDNKGTVIGVQFTQRSLTPALHQLRAPVGDFVGREREIEQLVEALSKAATSGAAAAISGVRGMGGIGKTELAYAAAQQLKDVFPDAQLLVELRGASADPLTPQAALQTIIRAFEREARLPDDLAQLLPLYRDKLTAKRALILADDAKDAAQVRPLLPPSGCALLVTSRSRFALPGMAALDLGTLPPQEAEKLLLDICPRVGEQAPELAKLCGYLPLALRVSAGVLANSARGVAHYLEQLEAERLKHLADADNPDDPQASVEASLRLSYDALEGAAQSALAQMSVFAASFDLPAASAAVQLEGDAEALLDLLMRRSLLEWDEQVQRYSLHDLVRAFAAARLEDAEAVWLRYARHYAQISFRLNDDHFKREVLSTLPLFERELTHIEAVWDWARERDGDPEADTLKRKCADAIILFVDLNYDGQRDLISHYEAALAVARRTQDRGAEGGYLAALGDVHYDLDIRKGIDFYQQALVILRETGNRDGEALMRMKLGFALKEMQFYVNILSKWGDPDAEKWATRLEQLHQRLAASQNTPPADTPDEG